MTEGPPEPADRRNTLMGLIFFGLYVALYTAFVLLNAFAPNVMAIAVGAGLNLAVAYGLGLIGTALALALLYAGLCRGPRAGQGEEDRR